MTATIANASTSAVPPIRTALPVVLSSVVAAVTASRGCAPGGSSSRWKRSRISRANPTPSASPVIVPRATPTGSSVIRWPSSATSPKPARVVIAPAAVTSSAATGARNPISRRKNRIPIAISSVRRRFETAASFSARSIDGCPVMYARAGAEISCATRRSICGSSEWTTSFSGRSTDTTIIAAVGLGRSAALARAGVPGGQDARLPAPRERGDQLWTLTVELLLRSLEQDRDQLRRTELRVGRAAGRATIGCPARP